MTSFEMCGAALAQSGQGMQIIGRAMAASLGGLFRRVPEIEELSGTTFLELEPNLAKEAHLPQR